MRTCTPDIYNSQLRPTVQFTLSGGEYSLTGSGTATPSGVSGHPIFYLKVNPTDFSVRLAFHDTDSVLPGTIPNISTVTMLVVGVGTVRLNAALDNSEYVGIKRSIVENMDSGFEALFTFYGGDSNVGGIYGNEYDLTGLYGEGVVFSALPIVPTT